MVLDLSARQRAMLLEMGVHVWWPAPAPDPAPATRPEGVRTITRVHRPPPVTAPAVGTDGQTDRQLPDGISSMDWQALGQAVAQCQACTMCVGRHSPVMGEHQEGLRADWMVVGDPPDEAQERAGQPLVGDAGRLLDRMLWAVGVTRYRPGEAVQPPAQTAYLTPVLKCRPASARMPGADDLATCSHYLQREIALVQPRVILAMGRSAMQWLLSQASSETARLPLGQLRGQVYRYEHVPVIVSYPPVYLLRNGLDKAKAWADLCLAADVVRASTQN